MFTVVSFSCFIAGSQYPARAFDESDGLSWGAESVDYYESFSQNNPVVRGAAKIGGAVAAGIDAGGDVLYDVNRVNAGVSRGKVLAGTVAKYGTQFVMQAGVTTAASFAAPFCALTPVSAVACTSAFVSANAAADRISDAYREGVETLFADEEGGWASTGDSNQTQTLWKVVAGVMRQNGSEVPMEGISGECEDMGAADAYQMVASAESPEIDEGGECFSSKVLNRTRDEMVLSQQCSFPGWGSTEVITTMRAIDDKTVNSGTIYVLPGGQRIEHFTVIERCS